MSLFVLGNGTPCDLARQGCPNPARRAIGDDWFTQTPPLFVRALCGRLYCPECFRTLIRELEPVLPAEARGEMLAQARAVDVLSGILHARVIESD